MSTPFFVFFDSDRENFAHVFYVPLRRPQRSLFFVFFFLSRDFLKNVAHLRPKLFGKEKKENGSQASGWPCKTRVQKNSGL